MRLVDVEREAREHQMERGEYLRRLVVTPEQYEELLAEAKPYLIFEGVQNQGFFIGTVEIVKGP